VKDPSRDLDAPPAPPAFQRLSVARLLILVALFVAGSGYVVVNSPRFELLIRSFLTRALTTALERPVRFEGLRVRLLPLSVGVTGLRVGNDPRVRERPFLAADELTVGGALSLVGRQLRIGSVRAVRPVFDVRVFPDGSNNLPPGLSRPARPTSIKLRFGHLLVQNGVFFFDEKRIPLDGEMDDLAADLVRTAWVGDHYRGEVVCRAARLQLPNAQPIRFSLAARFGIDGSRLHVDRMAVSGDFGELTAEGSIDDLRRPRIDAIASGQLHLARVEDTFGSKLQFSGDARVRARVQAGGGFLVQGRLDVPDLDAHGFAVSGLAATFDARPSGVIAHLDRGTYAAGVVSGVFRLGPFGRRPEEISVLLAGRGVSIERFFDDIHLRRTGLSGKADVDVALRWAGPIEQADGGGRIAIKAGPAILEQGRAGIPISGGGPVTIARGNIRFEGAVFRFPHTSLAIDGGFPIGSWIPSLDFHVDSSDLSDVDRLVRGFGAAIQREAVRPLRLAGSGRVSGHLEGPWNNPHVTFVLASESTVYHGIRFGTVQGDGEVRDGAVMLRPLRIYDGDARLSVEGMARYRPERGRPDLDLAVSSVGYPVDRLLRYLDLDLPISGRLSGTLPIRGTAAALEGGANFTLEEAEVWGQPFPRVRGVIVFTPGRVALTGLRASLDGAEIGGDVSLVFADKSITAHLAGDDVPLSKITALKDTAGEFGGFVSFHATAGGTVDQPVVTLEADVSRAVLFGRPLSGGVRPHLSVSLERGRLRADLAVAGHWDLAADGRVDTDPARISFHVDAPDVTSLLALSGVESPEGIGGAFVADGSLEIPFRDPSAASGRLTVSTLELRNRDGKPLLEAAEPIELSLAAKRIRADRVRFRAAGGELDLAGSVAVGPPIRLDLRLTGQVDAAIVAVALPEATATGKVAVDLGLAGEVARPQWSGSLRVENGYFKMAGMDQVFDKVQAFLRFSGGRVDVDTFRARVGGGDLLIGGTATLSGLDLSDFRLKIEVHNVAVHPLEDFRLVADADLALAGNPSASTLRGVVTLVRGTYSRDFDITLKDLFAPRRKGAYAGARETWRDHVGLEVRIASSAALEIRNNLASLTATADLLARGTLGQPSLFGQVVIDEGGTVTLRDVKYTIESGSLTFANPVQINPILDVSARATVRGYDITVQLSGTLDRLRPIFASDPPLTNDEVIGLLVTGSLPETGATAATPGSTVTSTVSGILLGSATESVGRRLFRLDKFQIDPVFVGSTFAGAQITVGKQITRDLSVTYSRSTEANAEDIFQAEYRLSDAAVLELRRDENGVYFFDLKIRKRY
jgi:TamB, inner membrane protein subunit of TAM complex